MNSRTPKGVLRFCWAISLAGMAVFAAVLAAAPALPVEDATFWLLTAGVVVAELFPLRIPRRGDDEAVTIATTFSYALLITSGLPAAIVVQAAASVIQDALVRKPVWRILFNVGQYTLSLGAAALVLHAFAALPVMHGLQGSSLETADFPAVVVGAAAYFLVNATVVGIAVALYRQATVVEYLRSDAAFIAMLAAVLLSLAPVVIASISYSPAMVPLLIAPFVLVHRFVRQSSRAQHAATHDSLTSLANRERFQELVSATIEDRGERAHFAVLLLDLDRFKEINDTLGHHYGDHLLAQVGPRLSLAVRSTDVVARLGGDEFGVLMRDLPAGSRTALEGAERIRAALSQPFDLDGFVVEVDSSIGIAMCPEDGRDIETLLQRADVAMYRAKETHSDYLLYNSDYDHHSPARLALVSDLRQALDRGGIELWYQPKLDLATGAVSGVEALVRWEHPTLGMLQPSAFIDLAERTGLIKPLTHRVLELALTQRRAWLAEGLDLLVAVNVSARSLLDRRFPGEVARLLERYELRPGALKLEITESSIMADPIAATATIGELRTLGIEFGVDDFGTGYSSLAHLRSLPVSELKIDKGFVLRMGSTAGDAAIVRSTIDLGHNLGLRVVAEGVEDADALALLRELGCDEAQGFYIARPMPAPELGPWLSRHRERSATVTPLDARRRLGEGR
ncbi:MAG TPA: EAL domain-containing protein [Thermoleophilaceae bacterium]|jgi:diguanylate cyclase (GGDEF)-like protein